MTQLLVGVLWAAVLLVSPALVSADQATYIYDDLGRLSQAIDGQGNVATYTYDAVGNLLSIARNTGGVGAPTITGFTPNTGNAGATVNISLTGTNLTGAALEKKKVSGAIVCQLLVWNRNRGHSTFLMLQPCQPPTD